MRFRNSYIPLNDDVNKLLAFAPSLDRNWRDNQRIKSKPFQIETLDVVNGLRDEGWKVGGVAQNVNKNSRKMMNHFVKLYHPDYKLYTGENRASSNNSGTIAAMNVSNSCTGFNPLEMDLGAYRLVCANGLVAFDRVGDFHESIQHTEVNFKELEGILCGINLKTEGVMKEFGKLQERELSDYEMAELAEKASNIRFSKTQNEINSMQLLNVVRDEDRGNNLWTVYNRIQENLTQTGKIVDSTGKVLSGTLNPREDTRVNKELFKLVHAYA